MIDQLLNALSDRYQIEREIGRGGMATVYLARDVKHERFVALKVLDPELGAVLGGDRFLSEIRVTANLQHPNLLPLFDSGSVNGLLYYVMPYVEGESLRHKLDRERQLPVDEAVRIAVGIANALDYAHGHGVIHRDLKPENILLQHGQPIVADFGIALAVSNAGGQRVTQTGLSLGTPQYMSPEQATGDRVIDGRTDIYSLAALAYEMLAGEPPHSGTTAQAIIARLMTERPRPISVLRPTVPEYVDLAVQRGLEKLPADRYSTAHEFAEALDGRHREMSPARAMQPNTKRAVLYTSLLVLPWLLAAALAMFIVIRPRSLPNTLQLARQLTFEGNVKGVGISADGTWLAYVTEVCRDVAQSCGSALEVREVDGTQSVKIARWLSLSPTVRWSPDGAQLLFQGSNDTLGTHWFVTNRLGGSIRRLPVDGDAGAFMPDGNIVIGGSYANHPELYRVDASTLRLVDSVAVNCACQLGDIAFRRKEPQIAASVTYVGLATHMALIASDGNITDTMSFPMRVAVRWNQSETSIVTVTFSPGLADDLRQLPVNGSHFERTSGEIVLGQIETGFDGRFDVARNGRTVVLSYQNSMGIRASDLSARSEWKSITTRSGFLAIGGTSPDGKRVAADATDNIGDNIYSFPLDGGEPTAVTAARGVREKPHFSPDGKRLLYTVSNSMLLGSTKAANLDAALAVSDVSGGRETVIYTSGDNGDDWLDNGSVVLLSDRTHFSIVDTTGKVLSTFALPDSVSDGINLAVSASKMAAFWSRKARAVVIYDLGARHPVSVVRSNTVLTPTRWTADGSLYAFTSRIEGLGSQGLNDATVLMRLAPGASAFATAATLPLGCSVPTVTPDGTHAVCDVNSTRPDVWLADRPGKSGW